MEEGKGDREREEDLNPSIRGGGGKKREEEGGGGNAVNTIMTTIMEGGGRWRICSRSRVFACMGTIRQRSCRTCCTNTHCCRMFDTKKSPAALCNK